MLINLARGRKAVLRAGWAGALYCMAGLATATPFSYVVNRHDSNVSVVDVASNQIVSTIPAGMASPQQISISRDGRRAYLSSVWSTNIAVLDLDKRTWLTSIPMNYTSNGVVLHSQRELAYADINAPGSAMIAVIDTSTLQVLRSFATGATKTQGLAASTDGTRLYSLEPQNELGGARVAVIDALSYAVLGYIGVGADSTSIQMHPGGSHVYVLNRESHNLNGSITVIDTRTHAIAATVPVGRTPTGMAFNPASTQAYVVNSGDDTVSVVDTRIHAVVGGIAVGTRPQQVAFHSSGTRAYVSNQCANTMSIIDTASQQVLATVPVGRDPWGIGFAGNALNTLPSERSFLSWLPSLESLSDRPEQPVHPQSANISAGVSRSGPAQSVPVSGVWAGLLLLVAGIGALHHHGRKLLG